MKTQYFFNFKVLNIQNEIVKGTLVVDLSGCNGVREIAVVVFNENGSFVLVKYGGVCFENITHFFRK